MATRIVNHALNMRIRLSDALKQARKACDDAPTHDVYVEWSMIVDMLEQVDARTVKLLERVG